MKGRKKSFSDYATYFNLKLPNSAVLLLYLIIIGAVAGAVSTAVVHYSHSGSIYRVLLYGAGNGFMVITLPALLTIILLKVVKRRLRARHALFATLVVSVIYALFIIIDALSYSVLNSAPLEYVILLLGNAVVYGYWFIVGKIVIGQKKSAVITASFQPLLNVLLYLPLGGYILAIALPVNLVLIKLYGGIAVFLAIGYATIYLLDRPGKKALDTKPIEIFSLMTEQVLYNITRNPNPVLAKGEKRSIGIDVLLLKGRKKSSVFVKPDLHYGPFAGAGGSSLPESLGSIILNGQGAVPFIMHGAVNIDDNPLYVHQIDDMQERISAYSQGLCKRKAGRAYGGIGYGSSGRCRAIGIRINDAQLMLLSKAPYVTEDIARGVGKRLETAAGSSGIILIDMHNSRFESAPEEELKGVYEGSKYELSYYNAIKAASYRRGPRARMAFGSSCARLKLVLNRKDLGTGYTSAGVFSFGKRRLCIIYFDANNMLPGFRKNVISYVKSTFGIDTDVCTTDTHSVNTITLSASNSLGRHTKESEIYPHLHKLVSDAIANSEYVDAAYGRISMDGFYTWGEHSFENILKMAVDVGRTAKHVLPFIIVAGFIIAAWVIYAL